MNKNVQNIITVVAIVSLVIVSFIAFSGDSDNSPSFSSDTASSSENLSDEEFQKDLNYTIEALEYMADIQDEILALNKLSTSRDRYSDTWHSRSLDKIVQINIIIDDIRSMHDPPEHLKKAHEYLLFAADYYDLAADYYLLGAEYQDQESFDEFNQMIMYGNRYITETIEELQ